MADVLILVGSESDKPRIEPAFEILTKAGVIIAGAGLSAALPGFAASLTDLPVIGVPFAVGPLNGLDALLATVQVPPGVPVATVGIDNATNAAHLALRILGKKA